MESYQVQQESRTGGSREQEATLFLWRTQKNNSSAYMSRHVYITTAKYTPYYVPHASEISR